MRPTRLAARALVASCLVVAACGSDAGSSADAAASDVADDTAPSMPPCIQACLDAAPQGGGLLSAWFTCSDEACGALQDGTAEYDQCVLESWAPNVPSRACGSETDSCFSGPIAGCKELVDVAASECEPATLPIPDEVYQTETPFCLIRVGFRATSGAQALAWPLYACTFDEATCLGECQKGAAACRACAQSKCGDAYAACMAQSAALPADSAPGAVKAQCQDAFFCAMSCSP